MISHKKEIKRINKNLKDLAFKLNTKFLFLFLLFEFDNTIYNEIIIFNGIDFIIFL